MTGQPGATGVETEKAQIASVGPVGIDNEVTKMTIVVTATYDSAVAIENVVEDLVATGIDRDKIYDDEENHLVKVMVPASRPLRGCLG